MQHMFCYVNQIGRSWKTWIKSTFIWYMEYMSESPNNTHIHWTQIRFKYTTRLFFLTAYVIFNGNRGHNSTCKNSFQPEGCIWLIRVEMRAAFDRNHCSFSSLCFCRPTTIFDSSCPCVNFNFFLSFATSFRWVSNILSAFTRSGETCQSEKTQ